MISSIRSDADSTALFDCLPYFRLGFSSQLLLVIVFALCLIISGMMASVSPLLTSALVDNISKKTSYDTIMISSALIGFAALIDIVVSYLSTLLSMRIRPWLHTRLFEVKSMSSFGCLLSYILSRSQLKKLNKFVQMPILWLPSDCRCSRRYFLRLSS